MPIRFRSKAALVPAAALALYVPALGLPLPEVCAPGMGVAGAAPSPSCGSDLRECLRQSADMRQTTFGGRYVTAEDVARCMEVFDSCIHGGASQSGTQSKPGSTTQRNGSGKATESMPQRFTIAGEGFECTASGNSVTCSSPTETYSSGGTTAKKISGTLSGLTLTGTRTDHFVGPSVNGCVSTVDSSWPLTYDFNPDGTGQLTAGSGRSEQTLSGSCSGRFSDPVEGFAGAIEWSPIQ